MPASEERSLHEFPSAMSILATTLLWVSTVAPSSTSGYDSEKTTAIDLASAILGDFEYTQDLATNVKTIFGAINSIMVLSGTTVPSSAIGSNGQLYVKYTTSGGVDTVDGLYWKINNAWVEISTGGGGGGATVTLGTTVPSDASGSNGDLYVQYDGTSYAVIEYFVKINGSWRKAPYSRVVALTQAEYDLITPDPTTLYIITDAQSSYQTKTDANLQTTATTVVGAINELKGDIDPSVLRTSLNLGNFAVYSAERILNNASKDIPLTQNLFVLFIKSYANASCYGVYLVSYHGSVATSEYISKVATGSAYLPTLSIVDGNKLRIATYGVDVYYSMLRLN